MAWDDVITNMIPNYTSDGTNMTLPIASFTELTAAEAHTTTGDSRKLLYAFLERINTWWTGLAVANRSGRISIVRSQNYEPDTGDIIRTYTIQMRLSPATIDVKDEA